MTVNGHVALVLIPLLCLCSAYYFTDAVEKQSKPLYVGERIIVLKTELNSPSHIPRSIDVTFTDSF